MAKNLLVALYESPNKLREMIANMATDEQRDDAAATFVRTLLESGPEGVALLKSLPKDIKEALLQYIGSGDAWNPEKDSVYLTLAKLTDPSYYDRALDGSGLTINGVEVRSTVGFNNEETMRWVRRYDEATSEREPPPERRHVGSEQPRGVAPLTPQVMQQFEKRREARQAENKDDGGFFGFVKKAFGGIAKVVKGIGSVIKSVPRLAKGIVNPKNWFKPAFWRDVVAPVALAAIPYVGPALATAYKLGLAAYKGVKAVTSFTKGKVATGLGRLTRLSS